MNFLHPWALGLGAAAVTLPVVIHLLTKPRPVRLPLSTIKFVLRAVQQRRARHRLRDAVILAFRVLAVALLAWAFARPLSGMKPLVASVAPGVTARVVILDQSQSMAAVSEGATGFDRGRPVAAKFLVYQPNLRANLILAAAQARATFAQLSPNTAAMHEELSTAKPRPERLDLAAAINAAAEMLAKVPNDTRRELVIVSDFQRSNWVAADFSPLPRETMIQLESVAPQKTPANLALLRAGAVGRIEQGREVLIEAEVGNYSSTTRQVTVEVSFGQAVERLSGVCPPGVATTLSAHATLREVGWLAGQAKIVAADDALVADDARPLVLHVRATPVYAMITREPSEPRAVSSHFLERALVPHKADDAGGGERVSRLDPIQLDAESLATAAAIVVDHPGKMTPSAINLLAGLLRRGRGVFYVCAEPVDAVNLKALSDAAGTDLRMPVEFMPPPAGQLRRDLFLSEVRRAVPPFAEFGESLPGVIGPLRFSGGLSSRRLESGLADEVVATFSDRSACLVVTYCGAGTLAVLNVDLRASNLTSSPLFVPLVGETMGRLLSRRREEATNCGEAITAYLPPDAGASTGLKLAADYSTAGELGSLTEEGGSLLWRCPQGLPPGVYSVKRAESTVFALAAAIPGLEGDLQTTESPLFTTRLAGGRPVHYQTSAGEPEHKDDAWAWMLVACTVCILGEVVALKAFGT